MRNMIIVVIVLFCFLITSISVFCMDLVQVETSNKKLFSFPQWKIEASRVLHTKQQWQLFKEKYERAKPTPIVLKTIDSKKLELFSQALEAQDFSAHCNGLAPEEKRLLTCAAGEQELDSPVITSEFLYVSFPLEFIDKNICPHLSTFPVAHYLQRLIILENCECKKFTRLKTENYGFYLQCKGNRYNVIPKSLLKQTNFNGFTFPISGQLSKGSESQWLINNFTNVVKGFVCFITPVAFADKNELYKQENLRENEKKLWIKKLEDGQCVEKIIKHSQAIENTVFSKNGQYLATSSEGPKSELILTRLHYDTFTNANTFLNGYEGRITALHFNNQSTIVAAATERNVYFWDLGTCSLLQKIDCSEGEIDAMCFNQNDAQLATLSFNQEAPSSTIVLWDLKDMHNITLIKTITFNDLWIDNIAFSLSGDKLIVGTKKSAVLLNALTGESIMDTGVINQGSDRFAHVNAALMPHKMDILVTQTHSDKNEHDKHTCNVALWDINSKKCIGTLLENEEHLLGIGVSSDGRSIVATIALFDCIEVMMYDDNAKDLLEWIATKSDLLQKYLLLRLYRAKKLNDNSILHPNSPEYRILQSLPTESCNVKELVEKYLLKK